MTGYEIATIIFASLVGFGIMIYLWSKNDRPTK